MIANVTRILIKIAKRNPLAIVYIPVSALILVMFKLLHLHKWLRLRTIPLSETMYGEMLRKNKSAILSHAKMMDNIFHSTSYSILKHEFDKIIVINGTKVGFTVNGREASVYIRGSFSDENWVDNVDIIPVYNSELRMDVTTGYSSIFDEIMPVIRESLSELEDGHTDGKEFDTVTVCGWSLGGALASMVTIGLSKTYNVVGYSVSSPRFTTCDYSSYVDDGTLIQIQKVSDVVGYLPMSNPFMKYRHRGDIIMLFDKGRTLRVVKDSIYNRFVLSSIVQSGRIGFKQHLTVLSDLKHYINKL